MTQVKNIDNFELIQKIKNWKMNNTTLNLKKSSTW